MGFYSRKVYHIFICEIFRKCDLLLILLMFILHMEIYLSTLLMVMFTGGFELYVPGPGCVSTSPLIRINCNTNNRKTMLISGIVLYRRNRDKRRAEQCTLVSIICWYDFARNFTSPYRHIFLVLNQRRGDELVQCAQICMLHNRKSVSIYRYLMRVTLSIFKCFAWPITAFVDD